MVTDCERSTQVATQSRAKAGLNMDRFWRKVDEEGRLTTECWNWTGATKGKGYGSFWLGGKPVRAHRVAWEFTHGPVPSGLFVLHRCNNRLCCNPGHLYLGDNEDNMIDMHRAAGHKLRDQRKFYSVRKLGTEFHVRGKLGGVIGRFANYEGANSFCEALNRAYRRGLKDAEASLPSPVPGARE